MATHGNPRTSNPDRPRLPAHRDCRDRARPRHARRRSRPLALAFPAAVQGRGGAFAQALRAWRNGRSASTDMLRAAPSVTDAIYDAGYAASSAAYRDSQHLGMAPRRLQARRQGRTYPPRHGEDLAGPDRGGRHGARHLHGGVRRRAGTAGGTAPALPQGDASSRRTPSSKPWVKQVVNVIDDSRTDPSLPLDIRGTSFQTGCGRRCDSCTPARRSPMRSWRRASARRAVRAPWRGPARPTESRCSVPCHRVVASDGALTGYKWGIERKRRLLRTEQAAVAISQASSSGSSCAGACGARFPAHRPATSARGSAPGARFGETILRLGGQDGIEALLHARA